MPGAQILNVINSGDIASLLDLIGEDRSINLNAAYPWDAANTRSPFQAAKPLPKPLDGRPPLTIPAETYECTPINLATLTGNKSIVRILLQNGADPNQEDSRKRNALICALYGIDTLKMKTETFAYLSITLPEYLDLIRILIPHMVIASMNRPLDSLRGTSILCFACYLGKYEAVKLLLSSEHISVNAADCKGATALMYAVREGHFKIIRELVHNKARPELTNQEGFSAIQYARNSPSITHELEKALAFERVRNADTTLFTPAIANFKSKLELILADKGPDSHPDPQEVNKAEPTIDDSHQKFLSQVQRGEIESVQQQIIGYIQPPYKLEMASLINFHDRVTGLTPMHKAVCNSNETSLSIIESLYLAGSDLNSASWSGRTPLHHLCILASQFKPPSNTDPNQNAGNLFPVLAARMVDLGALLNVVDKKGKTPLHYAVKGEESILPLVSVLLSKGADPLLPDSAKRTPIDSAENPAILLALKDSLRVESPEPEPPRTPPSRRRPAASTDFSRLASEGPSEHTFETKSDTSSNTLSCLGDTVQDFLDQYRIFDSTIALECLPTLHEIKGLVSSRVIAGGVRHQFNLSGAQEIASFVNLVVAAAMRIDNASQRHGLLLEKQEVVMDDIHTRYRTLTQTKDSMVSSWRQGADSLPQIRQDLRTLATRISNCKSECNFLVKSFTNKRLTFLGEFQRQMAAQKCSVRDNNAALTNLVDEELLDFQSISSREDRRASSESGSSEGSQDSSEADSLERRIRALTSISKHTQAEIDRIKAKLSELRDQKSILFSEFTAQFNSSPPARQDSDVLAIPLADLATQAEMLTNQHERLLALLERHINQNERQTAEISEARAAMCKQTAGEEWSGFVSSPTEMRPVLTRSTSFGGIRQPSGEAYPPSQKLIDIMLQIQAIDLALFSLNTWIPYRLERVRTTTGALDANLEKLFAKVEEVGSDVTWTEQFTVQLRQSIANRESSLGETVRSREAWLMRARLAIGEAKAVGESGASSHSLKHWQWDYEGAFRDCQVSNLEESCLVLASDMDSHHAHLTATSTKTISFLAQLRFQEQYLRTKLHSADPTKPGAFHELQQLEAYLDKIKSRDTNVHPQPTRGAHRRSSSLFSTPDLSPSSPTASLSSTSLESGYDSILSFHRRKLSEDMTLGDHRPSISRTSHGSGEFVARRISDDAYYGRGSLFKTAIPEEGHVKSVSLRRSSSTLSLKLASKNRPLSNHSVSSAHSSPQLESLRNSSSMSTVSLSRASRGASRLPALSRISTLASQSVTSFTLPLTRAARPDAKTTAAPRRTLRRITSEIHPGAKSYSQPDSAISSPTTSEPSSADRLVSLLASARREVEVLERLVPSSILPSDASELDVRRHALLTKKRVQIRQLNLALQKLGRGVGSLPSSIPQPRVSERRSSTRAS